MSVLSLFLISVMCPFQIYHIPFLDKIISVSDILSDVSISSILVMSLLLIFHIPVLDINFISDSHISIMSQFQISFHVFV